ncbi:MAG: helix-turn-helix transcriptional regulator, partial [Actinomycetaceae bacterium]|nr:helix-turn-helix transcriptional regulator [Actinomycetaceae bacterium]
QGQLAKELDVDPTTVGKWELGLAFPRPLTLIKLAELYKVPIQDFYSALKEEKE